MPSSSSGGQTAFQREVANRFGLVPNFFASALDAPEIIERLWDFAKAAYLDNPIPSLFKERLFVYLSRFCEVRYCIVRHCAFLVGRGHSSGDASVVVQTVEQAVKLLKTPSPWDRDLEVVLGALEALPTIGEWPAPETEPEDWFIAAATLVFVEPARSERARNALRRVLGGNRFEHLLGLLAFIRIAHYWTVLHPELTFEEDARELLRVNEALSRLLLQDPEAARCDMSTRLCWGLTELRELNERRELEKAKSEAQVRQKELFVEHAPAAIAMFDREMRYLAVSRQFIVDYGLPQDAQLIGRSHYEVFPDIPQRWRDVHARVLAGEELSQEEDQFARQDGRIDWVRWSMVPWRWTDGNIGGALLFSEPRTEQVEARRARKLAAQTLAERDLQLALAGRASLVGSYAYDTATEILQVSEGYAAVHGFPEGTTKIPRSQWLAGVHPEDVVWLEKCRSQAFRQRRAEYSVDYRILLPGRELRWIEARCFITYDDEEHTQRVVGVIIDVTERRQTEKALAERKAQLELANNIAQVGSYTYDYTTGTLWLGPGSASIYGLRENSVEMTADEWRKCVHPKDLPQLVARSRQALANRQCELVCVFRILRNEAVRWIETRNRYFYDKAGRATQAIGVSIDITERRRDEDLKSILIAELDHRVKNALATVKAVVSHTSEGSRSVANFVVALEGRIRSMATTHELLSARRWEGVLLAELVRHELAPYATRNNTEINGPKVVLKPEAGQAMAMVLHELATNAAKYGALSTKEGRVSIRWDRRLNGHPTHLVLEWQETGGPPVAALGKSSYGTSTIRDLIPYEFGGTVDLVLAPEGVQCRLELPADWLGNDRQPFSETTAHAV